MSPEAQRSRIKLGVSACILGEEVRWNGGHKRARFVTDEVSKVADFVAVCPEAELGMGVPREPVRLERLEGVTRMVGTKSGIDHTESMRAWCDEKVADMAQRGLSGFILKSNSPSCGILRVKVYGRNGSPSRTGQGFFVEALRNALPELPLEEDGRLNDPAIRESFFRRVYGFDRIQGLFREGWTVGDLVASHTTDKLLLMAHRPSVYKELGRLVAHAGELERDDAERQYRLLYMDALSRPVSHGRHVNVLQHAAGYLRDCATTQERDDVHRAIESYAANEVPLAVPLSLLRMLIRSYDLDYLAKQTYFDSLAGGLRIHAHV